MILEMIPPKQLELRTGKPQIETARRTLAELLNDGVYLQMDRGRPFIRSLQGPLYRRLVSSAVVSWALRKKYLVPDGCDDQSCLWLTDEGRKILGE